MTILKKFFLFILLLNLTSCMTIQDEIWINKNKTGKREVKIDMSEAYPLLKMSFAKEMAEKDEQADSEEEKDPIIEMLERGMTEGKLDTLYAEPREKWKKDPNIVDQKVRIQLDDDLGIFSFTSIQQIKDVYQVNWAELGSNDMMNMNQSPTGTQPNPLSGLMAEEGIAESIPVLQLQKKRLTIKKKKGEKPESGEGMEMLNMMADKGSYTYRIHFPKKVKEVRGEGIVKKGKKTVELVIPMKELLSSESAYDISVKFK